jgi:flagellar biogenesis protein FliO
MTIESATPLGERRSLVIVKVEGRRLLLGLTPMNVSLVTELAPALSEVEGQFENALRDSLGRPEPQL